MQARLRKESYTALPIGCFKRLDGPIPTRRRRAHRSSWCSVEIRIAATGGEKESLRWKEGSAGSGERGRLAWAKSAADAPASGTRFLRGVFQ